MAKISRLAGSTSHVLTVFIQDSTSSTGGGLTGLAFGTASLTCYYKRNRGTASVAVTLVTITTLGTYVSGGFKEIDAANLPGFYEFHLPDAAMASGAGSVAFLLKGAASMVPCPLEIELTATNNQDAQQGGIAALPAAGTLVVSVAQTGDAFARLGAPSGASIAADIQTRSTYAGGAVASVTGNVGGNVVGNVNGNVNGNVVGTVGSVTGNVGGVAAAVTVGGYSAGQDPATLMLDVAASGHNATGSIGAKINSAAASGDPWATALPGSYVSGTAGNILGNRAGFLLASAGLDAVTVESGINARQALAIIGAACAGKASGLDTSTAVYYAMGAGGTSTVRISGTTDASGNRTATTLSIPA